MTTPVQEGSLKGHAMGRMLMVAAGKVALTDPKSGAAFPIADGPAVSPTIAPDGDVYFGVAPGLKARIIGKVPSVPLGMKAGGTTSRTSRCGTCPAAMQRNYMKSSI